MLHSVSSIGGGKAELRLGEVSPARSSANLNRTGPSISFNATVAIASERKSAPNAGNSRAMTRLNPIVRPACETRPDQAHLRSIGGSAAAADEIREETHVADARAPARMSATGQSA